ncbi:uncharacterized protein LOC127749881 [Frankliniella occidentalis]|uniref:Uncharacterized protein LOC127749881 n=1 Tax=Frankliniella occidentalis TaxID=133901 RepID=A0A9C6U3Z8_FRAOC|nr:uncharacterized protein LOC127749881 [Frankliniella occidentalis]
MQKYEDNQDLTDFLLALEKCADVPAGCLSTIKKHLTPVAEEPRRILDLKKLVTDELLVIDFNLQMKICKELVTYLRSSAYGSVLEKRVHQEVETRWNTVHKMLESVHRNFEGIQRVLKEIKQEERIKDIDRRLVEWLMNFLQPFKDETKNVEGNDYRTLPLVLLAKCNLDFALEPALLDTPAQAALRNRAAQFKVTM